VAGAATHSGLSRRAAEDCRRTEGHIAQIDQIRFATPERFRPKDLARPVESVLVQLASRGEHGLIAVNRKGRNRHREKRKPRRPTLPAISLLHQILQ
jgi:hypothetical protein